MRRSIAVALAVLAGSTLVAHGASAVSIDAATRSCLRTTYGVAATRAIVTAKTLTTQQRARVNRCKAAATTTTVAPTTTLAPKTTTTTVAGQTAGSATNKAPTVALNTAVNKSWPQCLSAKGSPVSFVVSDAAGSVLTVVLQVNGQTAKSDTVQLSGTSQAINVTFNAQQAGATVTITATDQGKLSGSLKQTLTKEVCP